MKFSKTIIATALLATTGLAQAELSGNIGAASNYIFRGVSLSGDAAAVSGGIDLETGSGFYAGTWMTNLASGSKQNAEVDLYAGFGGDMGAISYDVNGLYYYYPGDAGDIDYAEATVSAGVGPATASFSYTVWGEADDGVFVQGDWYASISADIPVDLGGFAPSVLVGYYDFTDDGDAAVGDASYTHVNVSLTKDAGDLGALTVSFDQTDGANGDAVSDGDPMFSVAWSKGF